MTQLRESEAKAFLREAARVGTAEVQRLLAPRKFVAELTPPERKALLETLRALPDREAH